jgi:hypothetical protein
MELAKGGGSEPSGAVVALLLAQLTQLGFIVPSHAIIYITFQDTTTLRRCPAGAK